MWKACIWIPHNFTFKGKILVIIALKLVLLSYDLRDDIMESITIMWKACTWNPHNFPLKGKILVAFLHNSYKGRFTLWTKSHDHEKSKMDF